MILMQALRALNIRKAVGSDAQGIYRVHKRAIQLLCVKRYPQEQIDAWAGSLAPERYEGVITKGEVWVAEHHEAIVGFSQLNLELRSIDAVYVDPAFGRQGAGTVLLKAAEEAAVVAGIASLWLDASLNSVAFYRDQGYEEVGQTAHRLRVGIDLVCMRMHKQIGITTA